MSTAVKKIVPDKRSAILEAAVTLFARQGFDGTTVPEIARLAGVAAGSIYVYFPSKEALVNAALVERKQAMLDAMSTALAQGGDLETRFRRVWRALVAFAVAHPDDFRFFEMHYHDCYLDPASRALGERVMAQGVAFMAEIAAAYGVAAPGPDVMVSLVWGALVGLLKSADQGFVKLDPQRVDAAGQVMWRAVAGCPQPLAISKTSNSNQERSRP